MQYLPWVGLAVLGGVGGVVSTGNANMETAAIMGIVAFIALPAACIWRLSRISTKDEERRNRNFP